MAGIRQRAQAAGGGSSAHAADAGESRPAFLAIADPSGMARVEVQDARVSARRAREGGRDTFGNSNTVPVAGTGRRAFSVAHGQNATNHHPHRTAEFDLPADPGSVRDLDRLVERELRLVL